MKKSEKEFGVAVKRFLSHIGLGRDLSSNTVISYRTDLLELSQFLKKTRAEVYYDEITASELRDFLVYLKQRGIQNRSIRRKVSSISSFFKFLVRQDEIESDPSALLLVPKMRKRLPEILTVKEMANVLNQPELQKHPRDLAILEIFYSNGIRLNELTQLNVSSFDFDQGTVKVLGKGKKERIIPVGQKALQALRNYLNKRSVSKEDEPAFINKFGERFSARNIARMVKRYLFTGTEKNLSPHIIRHSVATHLLQAGAPILVVKELLGHENLSATQIYTHLNPEDLKRTMKECHPKG